MAIGLLDLLLSGGVQDPRLRLGGEDTPAGGGALSPQGILAMAGQQQQAAPQQAMQAAQNAMAAPQPSMPQREGGGLLSRLFGGAQRDTNGTVQWLINKGYDPGAASAIASDPQSLRSAMMQAGGPGKGADPLDSLRAEKLQLEIDQARNPGDNWINVGDGRVFNERTGEFREAPGGSKKPPQIVELFDQQTGQPYKARWDDEKGDYVRVGGIKARSDGMSITTNPDGTTSIVTGGANSLPKLTESEGRSTGFYGRGVESHQILNNLESQGTSLWNSTVGNIPVVGNYTRSQDAQKYDQAKRNFINAVLRRESGAVISPEEFRNAEQQYFPQPGDGEEVIAQKRANRETTIQGLKVSSGQGANFALPPNTHPSDNPAPAANDGWQDMGGGVKIRRKQ